MYPEQVPVFTADDIVTGETDSYFDGDKATVSGWLKKVFWFDLNAEEDEWGADYIGMITKEYEAALKKLREVAKIPKAMDVDFWEETITAAKGKKVLNDTMKALGYTEVEEV